MGGACSTYGGTADVYTVFWWGNVRERRIKRRWEDNIKMDLQEVGWGDMDAIDLAQDRDRWRALVKAANEPSGSLKCREFLD
jgi:hypothetical protein